MRSTLCVRVAVAAVCIAMAAVCPVARASVILFDNLSNGNNGFFGASAGSWEAQRFKSDATNLQLISATLRLNSTTAGSYRLSLFSDVANQPGVSLGTLFNDTTANKPANGDVKFTFSQPMTPNTNYWIVLSADTGQPTGVGWGATSTLTGSGAGFQLPSKQSLNQGATWIDRSVPHQMQLEADLPVPEPSGVVLLLLGGAGFLGRRRAQSVV